jgi:hypothetical protein
MEKSAGHYISDWGESFLNTWVNTLIKGLLWSPIEWISLICNPTYV